MKRIRQYTYVERELIRRRAEKKRLIIEKVANGLQMLALVFCAEAIMFALFLMS